jgi:hypothetical protein
MTFKSFLILKELAKCVPKELRMGNESEKWKVKSEKLKIKNKYTNNK